MNKTVWEERVTAAGLRYMTKRVVKSRRRRERAAVDLAGCLDRIVAVAMYGWAVVLSVAVGGVLMGLM